MAEQEGIFQIRMIEAGNAAAVLKAFRAATPLGLSEIRSAVAGRVPVTVARFYGTDHDEAERRALALLETLDAEGARYEILLEGEVESPEYLRNVLARWHEISRRD